MDHRKILMTLRKPFIRTIALFTGFAVVAGATAARSDLADETTITEGLINVAIAYEIGERCDDLKARRLAGVSFLWGLKSEAQSLGYSSEEIDAFTEDRAAQDRLEGVARQRLSDLGAVVGQWDTYCAVGDQLIAENTVAGGLLR